MRLIIDFNQSKEAENWREINDTVMGGISSSRMSIDQGVATFSGWLSLENNGGFASVRRRFVTDQHVDRLQVRVKGDGRTYQLRIRMDGRFDGIAFAKNFETVPGQWLEYSFTEEDFIATWRGRRVADAPRLQFGKLCQLGFLVADRREGQFELQVDSIIAE